MYGITTTTTTTIYVCVCVCVCVCVYLSEYTGKFDTMIVFLEAEMGKFLSVNKRRNNAQDSMHYRLEAYDYAQLYLNRPNTRDTHINVL